MVQITRQATLHLPEGTTEQDGCYFLPNGEIVQVELCVMHHVERGPYPLDDEEAEDLGCRLDRSDPWPPCGGHLTGMTSPQMILFLSTPGHGYYAVPHALIEQSGVTGISRCSYTNGEVAYLEEDADGPKFLKAAEASGIVLNVREKSVNDDRFLHRLRPYA